MSDDESTEDLDHAAAKITTRISKIELARQHAQAGRREAALKVLRAVIEHYADDPRKQSMVQHMIERLEGGGEI